MSEPKQYYLLTAQDEDGEVHFIHFWTEPDLATLREDEWEPLCGEEEDDYDEMYLEDMVTLAEERMATCTGCLLKAVNENHIVVMEVN